MNLNEVTLGKPQTRRKTVRKIAPIIALAILLTIPLYNYPSIRDSSKKLSAAKNAFESFKNSKPQTSLLGPLQRKDEGVDKAAPASSHDEAAGEEHEKGRRKERQRVENNDGGTREATSSSSIIINNGGRGNTVRSKLVLDDEKCDLFSGEWVPNPEGPYYTNTTCYTIQQHQNCMKFGRPDLGFLKWRWKPDNCELPIFDPHKFLELVRGKSLAFVGDSVARNQMQSLICLLSRVVYPVDASNTGDQNKRYHYRKHDFNISMFWSPYLVKTGKLDQEPFTLYLDRFDEQWTTKVAFFDYVIISAEHWFFRPTYFYIDNRLIGCLYCPESNITHLTPSFSYRRAFRTAFRAINSAHGFKGVTILRTFAPSHFEGGAWNKGGDCVLTGPSKRNETVLKDSNLEMYSIQLEELGIAQKTGRRSGGKFRLIDATKSMLLRPDGHPSKYGHWQVANQSYFNDCVHWCLPGPIDSWNDILQELFKREKIEDK